jgi:hypothetical protein
MLRPDSGVFVGAAVGLRKRKQGAETINRNCFASIFLVRVARI